MTGQGALAAGWLLVLTTAALAAGGALLGGLIDLRFVGGLTGGVIGTVVGFVLVWRIFVVPANEASSQRDYSGIKTLDDDDDDEDSW